MALSITRSVGFGGVNLPTDVGIVQLALNAVPRPLGGLAAAQGRFVYDFDGIAMIDQQGFASCASPDRA